VERVWLRLVEMGVAGTGGEGCGWDWWREVWLELLELELVERDRGDIASGSLLYSKITLVL